MRTTSGTLIGLISLIAAPLAGGCGAAPTPTTPTAGEARLHADLRRDRADGDPFGSSGESAFAAQAQADADWLEARRRARQIAAAAPTDTAEPLPPPGGTSPSEVIFNEPSGRSPDRSVDSTAAADAPGRPDRPAEGPTADAAHEPSAADPAAVELGDAGAPPLAAPARRLPDDDALRASDDFPTLLVRLRRELAAQAVRSPQPVRELSAFVALALIEPDLQLPPDALAGLTEEERTDVEHLLAFFARVGRELTADGHADEVLRAAVIELQDAIARPPEIEVLDAQLCWRVESFGKYDAFTRPSFLAGEAQQVIVYLALGRFSSRRTDDGKWLTELAEQLEIYPAGSAVPVWSENWSRIGDEAGTRRQDFYTVWLVELPPRLSVGGYVLKVRVRDEQSGAETETSLSFDIVADPKRVSTVPSRP